jgi:Zn-dependent M16 (insulinase) family peptidase
MAGSFVEVARFVADGILVQKIKSKSTGLTIIKADVEGIHFYLHIIFVLFTVKSGPVVQGYFTLATEAHDDDGCPHVCLA